MGGPRSDALKISPQYTSDDWAALDISNPEHWIRAADMVHDRLNGRFLRYATNALRSPYSGFVVLAIDSLVLETLQQFRLGVTTEGRGKSEKYITAILARPQFNQHFVGTAPKDFYADIRCGLLHQAEARNKWLIWRNQEQMLSVQPGKRYIIDVRLFHRAVLACLKSYLREVRHPENQDLRAKLWKKMTDISNARTLRGVEFAVEPDP